VRAPTRRDLPLVALVVAAALLVGFLMLRDAGSDDPFASYCSAVEEHRAEIGAALGAGKETGLLRALPAFEDLASKAPDDIEDEWRTVVARVTELKAALDEAGVDPASYDSARPPAGLGAEDREAIATAATRLGSEDTAAALAGVEQQARDVCKSPLSL
jgi:hypothetical protein